MRSATSHAATRSKQRGIPPLIMEWLQAYGEEIHDHRGAIIRHFSKRSRRQLERDVGRETVRRMADLLRCYVVVSSDGMVITIGHRFRRIRRDCRGH